MRQRLDSELVRRGLARSRENAQELIEQGKVRVGGLPAKKSTTQVDGEDSIVVDSLENDFVSRGGHKLAGALRALPELVVTGKRALDAGASTGGFTEVLLLNGAREVIAIDVGYGQLAWNLQKDPRVLVKDRVNIRDVKLVDIGQPVELIVADLSFISLRTVLPALSALGVENCDYLLMVKPQFEVGREKLGAGGVVREANLRFEAIRMVADSALNLGLGCLSAVASSLPGPSGNVEYFLWLRRGAGAISDEEIHRAIDKGPA
jgi:23S rRNA (cytidine1920-2'-O)/16S rRNA (cytidine1409-2'-O)-methyltransferase